MRYAIIVLLSLTLTACGSLRRLSELGRGPEVSNTSDPTKEPNWRPVSMPMPARQASPNEANALWRPGSRAFFKDQRAAQVGDIITVLVSMTDSAQLKNVTATARTSGETAGIPDFAGLTSRLGATSVIDPSKLISLSSNNNNSGNGQIQRNETVTLRLAGVVTQVLPNGNLVVAARQEFRVNSELRELKATGVIRPQDIASDNTVLHDRMA